MDEGFVMMDILLLSLLLLALLGMVRYSFLVHEDAVRLEQRFMAEEIMQEYMDRMEMENDR
ncbi:hypothetical protein D081_1721 [Anaerovibrio sp. JC8]|nr:hypothetical protein D081_1721 [Anaerovibrio sp. JC8]